MDTMTEISEEKKLDFTQDKMHTYAWRIKKGQAGYDYIYCMEDGRFYCYQEGYWKSLIAVDFLGRIEENIPEITKYQIPIRKQIVENFKTIGRFPLDLFNQENLINFENYMFDPTGINVISHKKEFYSTIRIPYKYDALAKCDLWLKTLKEILENDLNKINILQEFIGYCLSTENEQKKGLLFLGDTDTGKSTIIDIIRELIGEMNCSNVPLQYLSNPQYTPLLINKKVNIDPEVNKNAVDYEREFKIITGGKNERVSCNQKHIPTFEFTPKCKIILSANLFPRITDHSSAFYQRLLLIPCNRRFLENEKDRELHDKLKNELSGIFNWAMEGLIRLRKRGRFEQYDFMKDAVEELEDENNPVNIFFKEMIEIDVTNNVYIEKGDLYGKYIDWTNKTNTGKLSLASFSRCVYKKYHRQTPKDTKNEHGKRIWRNLKYIKIENKDNRNVGYTE